MEIALNSKQSSNLVIEESNPSFVSNIKSCREQHKRNQKIAIILKNIKTIVHNYKYKIFDGALVCKLVQ